MDIIKKIIDLITQFLKFKEQQSIKEENYKIESQEKTNLEIETNKKAKKIAERKKNEKIDRSSDNIFGD